MSGYGGVSLGGSGNGRHMQLCVNSINLQVLLWTQVHIDLYIQIFFLFLICMYSVRIHLAINDVISGTGMVLCIYT